MSERGKHPNSRRGLRPATKGEVRNPQGKNQHWFRNKMMEFYAAEVDDPRAPVPRTPAQKAATKRLMRIDVFHMAVLSKAVKGGDAAQKLIMEHLNGAAPTSLQLTGANGGPVKVDSTNAEVDPRKFTTRERRARVEELIAKRLQAAATTPAPDDGKERP